MTVRRAESGDAGTVAALERELFGVDAWTHSSVAAELTGADRLAVVATRDDEVVGYATATRTGESVDLRRIGVHPRHRRRGIARALLAAVADWSRSNGCRVILEVSASNPGAVAFYRAELFAEVARRPRYYRDGSDAVVMVRRP